MFYSRNKVTIFTVSTCAKRLMTFFKIDPMQTKSKTTRKAIFLDRDGIVNEDTGYPCKPEQIRFTKSIFKFCKTILSKEYILVIVSNQAGVAKGYFSEDAVKLLHTWMEDKFLEQGIEIAGFYYCPFHKDGVVPEYTKDSNMRKPKPGMILEAARDLNIDINKSIMIGDKISDRIELDGLQSIIVRSKYTGKGYDAKNLESVEKMI